MKWLHVLQGITLIIAAVLLWVEIPMIDHMTAMSIATVIIIVNAILEISSEIKSW